MDGGGGLWRCSSGRKSCIYSDLPLYPAIATSILSHHGTTYLPAFFIYIYNSQLQLRLQLRTKSHRSSCLRLIGYKCSRSDSHRCLLLAVQHSLLCYAGQNKSLTNSDSYRAQKRPTPSFPNKAELYVGRLKPPVVLLAFCDPVGSTSLR